MEAASVMPSLYHKLELRFWPVKATIQPKNIKRKRRCDKRESGNRKPPS